jgi:hypothetical protein
MNMPEHGLSMHLDVGWPLEHKLPADGSHCHTKKYSCGTGKYKMLSYTTAKIA